MADVPVADLASLDRDVARACDSLAHWRSRIAATPDGDLDDPFEGLRHTASRTTFRSLRELSPSAAEAPLRDALVRWVCALVHARIGAVDEVAVARAMAVEDGRFEGEPRRRVSWLQSWRGLVVAKTPLEARLWLEAAAGDAPRVAAASRTKAARRFEVAKRLGFGHPWEPLVAVPRADLHRLARRLLDATEGIAHAVLNETVTGAPDAAEVLYAAAGRDAGEGWPARLSPHWFHEAFGAGVRTLPIRLPTLPRPVGAASFARALTLFGYAAGIASSRARWFALRREPSSLAQHRLAFAVGALPCDPVFHVKVLHLSRRAAETQARAMARTALLEARLHAARLVLGDEESLAPADAFAEWSTRLFGAQLDAAFAGAWPRARDEEPGRFLGLIQSLGLRKTLQDQFDSDWFRNPRAWAVLQDEAFMAGGIGSDVRELEEATAQIGRAFEEALG